MDNYTKLRNLGIDLKNISGQQKILCPKCSLTRKHKHDKSLSVNAADGLYNCHNCNWNGGVGTMKEEKIYTKPVWTNVTELSEKVVKFFSERGISQQTLIQMKITEGKEWMPQTQNEMNCIKFNYFRDGELVNIKFRDGKKNFKMVSKAELIFYNLDAIKEAETCIITEGEIDCLSFIEAGIMNVVSVPNGASKNQKLEYLDNCFTYFEGKKKIYLATDNDIPGMSLRDELARRLSPDICLKVDFSDCKDANEYMQKHGKLSLQSVLDAATEYPIDGIIEAKDLYDEINELYNNGLAKGETIGINEFDELVSFYPAQLVTITGIPSHGKSDYTDMMTTLLTTNRGWKFGVFSPENFPVSLHISKIAEKIIGKSFSDNYKMSWSEKEKAIGFIQDHFKFIHPKNEDLSIDTILDKAKSLVLKFGIKGLVIDPYNTLEHNIPKGVSETNYISMLLTKITAFNRKHNITTFLVAHPTKIPKDKITGKYEIPNLYSISGSANFFNKTDIGLCVYRDFADNTTTVYVQKVRFKHLGKTGHVKFKYNINNGRYSSVFEDWDNTNWLDNNNKAPDRFIQSRNITELPLTDNHEDVPF